MNKDPLAQLIVLPDGRRLGYAEFGNRSGPAVFHFHGLPGSRLEGQLLAKAAADLGIYLIGIDRPGMGLSDFLADRRIGDWPADVAALADALGIDKFSVEGFSGGGPYAAACAVSLPDRVVACGLVSSAGPRGIELGGQYPLRQDPSASQLQRIADSASRGWSGFAGGCRDIASASRFVEAGLEHIFPGGPDAVLGRDPKVQAIFAADFCEAFRQGIDGETREDILRNISWEFYLAEIPSRVPVFLWHGELDENVPVCVGRAVAKTILHSTATFYPNDGHISVLYYHAEEILHALISKKSN